SPAPFTVTLTADKTTLTTTDSASLTATSNQQIANTGYQLEILDRKSGAQGWIANSTASVSCTVSWTNAPHTYVAYVAAAGTTDPPPSIQATSNTVTIDPAPFTVTLTADKTTLTTTDSASLTATSNQQIANTGYQLEI